MRRAIDIAIDECVTSNNDLTKYKLTINHVILIYFNLKKKKFVIYIKQF